jgi:hypothetical protein
MDQICFPFAVNKHENEFVKILFDEIYNCLFQQISSKFCLYRLFSTYLFKRFYFFIHYGKTPFVFS